MNIVVISSDRYPDGGASANRHMAYAKGLVELGHSVRFICLSPLTNGKRSHTEDGIDFITAFHESRFSKYFRNHSSLYVAPSIKKSQKILTETIATFRIDVVILLNTHIWLLLPFLMICKRHGIKVIHERTEYPLVAIKRGIPSRIHHQLYIRLFLRKTDGIFVISKSLQSYFNELVKRKIPVKVINMIVDPSRFAVDVKNHLYSRRYIAYCGSMYPSKDGTDILIRAFCDAMKGSETLKDVDLLLVGDTADKSMTGYLNSVIDECQGTGRVVMTGMMERNIVPAILKDAEALVLARPSSKQAEGGFPTKLGEYLSTGKPVIVTDTGEIGLFLKDGYNAFLAEPGSVKSFSGKINRVFGNLPEASKIGLQGRQLVYGEFNYLEQAKELETFITGITRKTST